MDAFDWVSRHTVVPLALVVLCSPADSQAFGLGSSQATVATRCIPCGALVETPGRQKPSRSFAHPCKACGDTLVLSDHTLQDLTSPFLAATGSFFNSPPVPGTHQEVSGTHGSWGPGAHGTLAFGG